MSVRPTARPQWWSQLRPWGEPVTAPRARMLIAPHSGAGPNRYLRLVGGLPDDVEIVGLTLPGRERRGSERPGATLDEVLASLSAVSRPEVPTLVLGHSMGATLGLHLAHALGKQCVGLIASGQEPRYGAGWLSETSSDERGPAAPRTRRRPAVRAHGGHGMAHGPPGQSARGIRLGTESAERSRGPLSTRPSPCCAEGKTAWSTRTPWRGGAPTRPWGARCTSCPAAKFALFDPVNRQRYVEVIESRLAAAAEPAG